MAVMIGSARCDERGKATGGRAGDQTGREVSTQAWYLHAKGWRVLRCKDRHMALLIADAMRAACKNPKIGYDQGQRLTLYSRAKPLGFDPGRVATACETDCSALVRVCLAYAGILVGDFYTATEARVILATGLFEELEGAKYTKSSDYLLAGDILVTRTKGHTVVVLTDGPKAAGDVTPIKEVWQLGERILRNGCKGSDVRELQITLISLGHSCGSWGADGEFGDATELAVRAFQAAVGLEVDGEYGPNTHSLLQAMLSLEEQEPTPEEYHYARIIGGDCWARSAPNTEGARLGVAREGTCLRWGGVVSETGWLLVEYQNVNAWVSGVYGRLEE